MNRVLLTRIRAYARVSGCPPVPMSWQTYVDTNLVGTGYVTKGAIYGTLDRCKWASSHSFELKGDELEKLVEAFKSPDQVTEHGLYLGGEKFLILRTTGRSIYAKQGRGGAICVKTTKTVLVALYDDSIQPGACANVVEKLGDYLAAAGY